MFALGTWASYFSVFLVLLKQEYTVPSCRVYSLMTRGHCCPWQGHTGPIQESEGLDRLLVITFISEPLALRRLGFSRAFLCETKTVFHNQSKWGAYGGSEQHHVYFTVLYRISWNLDSQGSEIHTLSYMSINFLWEGLVIYNSLLRTVVPALADISVVVYPKGQRPAFTTTPCFGCTLVGTRLWTFMFMGQGC